MEFCRLVVLLVSVQIFAGQPTNQCKDDPTGEVAKAGVTCGLLKGMGCSLDLSTLNPAAPKGTLTWHVCPDSCDQCSAWMEMASSATDSNSVVASDSCRDNDSALPATCSFLKAIDEGTCSSFGSMCQKTCGLCKPEAHSGEEECDDISAPGLSCGFLPDACDYDLGTLTSDLPRGLETRHICQRKCKSCGDTYESSKFAPQAVCRDVFCNSEEWHSVSKMTQEEVNNMFAAKCADRPTTINTFASAGTCVEFLNQAYGCVYVSPSTVVGPDPLPHPTKTKLSRALRFIEKSFGWKPYSDANLLEFSQTFGASNGGSQEQRSEQRAKEQAAIDAAAKEGRKVAEGGFDIRTSSEAFCETPEVIDSTTGHEKVTCFSAPIPMFAGEVVDMISTLANPYPSTHSVSVLQTLSEFVEGDVSLGSEQMRPVPLTEMYVHHFVTSLLNGAGAEGLRVPQLAFPDPYKVVVHPSQGNNAWTNFHLINTLGVSEEDLLPCVECWCDNSTITSNGDSGGIDCCTNCPTTGDTSKRLKYHLKYTIEYRKVHPDDIPVSLTTINAASAIEYDVLASADGATVDVRTKTAPLDYAYGKKTGMKLLGCYGHQHIGGLGVRVLDKSTGQLVCDSYPAYGQSDRLGDEKGYLVRMSEYINRDARGQPKTVFYGPGHMVDIVSDYETATKHTGVMGLVILVSEKDRSELLPDPISNGSQFEPRLCGSGSSFRRSSKPASPVMMLHAHKVFKKAVTLFWLDEGCPKADKEYVVKYKKASLKSPEKWRVAQFTGKQKSHSPVITVKKLRRNTKYVFMVQLNSDKGLSPPSFLHVTTKK